MFEVFILLIVFVFLISVVQGSKRGEATLEERTRKPTIVEQWSGSVFHLSDSMSEMVKHSAAVSAQAKLKAEIFPWFSKFEGNVSGALRFAEERADTEMRLASEPEFRRIFNSIRFEDEDEIGNRVVTPPTEPDWAVEGPPAYPLPSVGNTIEDAMREKAFDALMQRHQEFVNNVTDRLLKEPFLASNFAEAMRGRGLANLYREYFSGKEAEKKIQSQEYPKLCV